MSGRTFVLLGLGLWSVGMFFLVRGFFRDRFSAIGLTFVLSGLVLQITAWLGVTPSVLPPSLPQTNGVISLNVSQILNDLTYWFDYSIHMVLHHPFTSMTVVVGAFYFQQALGAMKLIASVITLSLAAITAFCLDWLMF